MGIMATFPLSAAKNPKPNILSYAGPALVNGPATLKKVFARNGPLPDKPLRWLPHSPPHPGLHYSAVGKERVPQPQQRWKRPNSGHLEGALPTSGPDRMPGSLPANTVAVPR